MKQKNSAPPCRRNLVLAVSAALGALSAGSACADPLLTIKLFRDSEVMFRDADMSRWTENYVELGVGYNSANSLRFGQFSGLTDKGGFPIAGFNWGVRDQSNDAQYWQIHGANLGLDSRKFKAEGGVQGRWDVSFSFDGLKRSQTESAQFVHQGLGTSTLTLPAGWGGPPPVTLANLNTSTLRPFEIQQGRDIYRLGIKGLLGPEWDYKVNYREDRRDGTRLTGISYSFGGAAIVPYQIDDKTQQIEAVLSYTSKIAQFQLGYSYSRFDNALNAFNVQNPFFTSTAPATANRDQRMSLAPDNDHHQINATGAYWLGKTTRLAATYSYGIARQNEAFLRYSVNGAAATAALPRNSLDGKVINTLLDVALTTKPIDKMNLKVAYQYRDSDNRTPVNQYTYAGRDATAVGAATSAFVRTNSPMSSTEQKVSLEGDYEIAARTVLRAGLEHSDKEYTHADRKDIQTDKLSIELRRPISDEFLGSAGYVRTQRRGSDYDKNRYFRNTYLVTNTQSPGVTNHPSMRSFIWADFNEDRVRTSGNWTVNETLSLQGVVEGYQQKMRGADCNRFNTPAEQARFGGALLPDTCLGRDEAEGASVSLDLQYQPEENLTTFAFANFSQTEYKQIGRTWSAGNTTGALDARNWYGDMLAQDHTVGFGLKWQPVEKWDLGGTYVFNYGKGGSTVDQNVQATAPAIVASTPMPNTWSKLHSVQLFAKWDYGKQLSWRFNYVYENLKSYDWAISDVPATGNANVLFTGQQAPRYSNHVFGVSAVVKSW